MRLVFSSVTYPKIDKGSSLNDVSSPYKKVKGDVRGFKTH